MSRSRITLHGAEVEVEEHERPDEGAGAVGWLFTCVVVALLLLGLFL